jgi:hypothetical protein
LAFTGGGVIIIGFFAKIVILWKLAPVSGHGVHAEHVVEPGILLAEGVGQGDSGTVVGLRRVQRGG